MIGLAKEMTSERQQKQQNLIIYISNGFNLIPNLVNHRESAIVHTDETYLNL